MRIDVRPRKRNAPRPAEKVAHGYLQFIRGRNCACQGNNLDCDGKMQAAHGPHKASKGMASKCEDRWALPLSEACHRLQHQIGWPEFERRFLGGVGMALKIAAGFWQAWPGRRQWEAKNDG
jgi:hypothetical protein